MRVPVVVGEGRCGWHGGRRRVAVPREFGEGGEGERGNRCRNGRGGGQLSKMEGKQNNLVSH